MLRLQSRRNHPLFTDGASDLVVMRSEALSFTPFPSYLSINFGTITAKADGSVDTSDVEGVDSDLRVRPFFLHGETMSIREFLVGAFNAEMGLEGFNRSIASDAIQAQLVRRYQFPQRTVHNPKRDATQPSSLFRTRLPFLA